MEKGAEEDSLEELTARLTAHISKKGLQKVPERFSEAPFIIFTQE